MPRVGDTDHMDTAVDPIKGADCAYRFKCGLGSKPLACRIAKSRRLCDAW